MIKIIIEGNFGVCEIDVCSNVDRTVWLTQFDWIEIVHGWASERISWNWSGFCWTSLIDFDDYRKRISRELKSFPGSIWSRVAQLLPFKVEVWFTNHPRRIIDLCPPRPPGPPIGLLKGNQSLRPSQSLASDDEKTPTAILHPKWLFNFPLFVLH